MATISAQINGISLGQEPLLDSSQQDNEARFEEVMSSIQAELDRDNHKGFNQSSNLQSDKRVEDEEKQEKVEATEIEQTTQAYTSENSDKSESTKEHNAQAVKSEQIVEGEGAGTSSKGVSQATLSDEQKSASPVEQSVKSNDATFSAYKPPSRPSESTNKPVENAFDDQQGVNDFISRLTQSKSYDISLSQTNTVQNDTAQQKISANANMALLTDLEKLDEKTLTQLKHAISTLPDEVVNHSSVKDEVAKLLASIEQKLEHKAESSTDKSISTTKETVQSLLAKQDQSDAKSKFEAVKSNTHVEFEQKDDKAAFSHNEIRPRLDKELAKQAALDTAKNTQSAVSNGLSQTDKANTPLTQPVNASKASQGESLSKNIEKELNALQTETKVSDKPLIADLVASNNKTKVIDNSSMTKEKVTLSSLVSDSTSTDNADIEGEATEQLSFSQLLNGLQNKATSPALMQLMGQIQSVVTQQSQETSFYQSQVTQHVNQLASATKKETLVTEQALQQPVNIAGNDAAKALLNKANMLLNLNLKEAEIRLDPPELGSMQIRIRSDAEQAQINFVVQNQQAKEMLEQSMGKLREMLDEQGIALGESHVSQQQSESEQGTAGDQSAEHGTHHENNEMTGSNEQNVSKQKDGIDFYA